MKKLLLALLITTSTFAQLQYRYERDLIEMFEDMDNYSHEEKQAMGTHVAQWIKELVDDYAAGNISITKKDKNYIERMSYMATQVLNHSQSKS